ncbi:MAG: glycosyl transferase, partial [Cyclobacteriaceae bacterium]
MNILIITYYWPPAGGIQVYRTVKFVKYLSRKKYNIFVYTAKNPYYPFEDKEYFKDIPPNVKIIKTKIIEPLRIFTRILNLKKNISANSIVAVRNKKTTIIQKIFFFIRGNLFIPDARMFWIKPSV